MKHIYDSPFCGKEETSEQVHIYEFENDDEFYEFDSSTHNQRCEMLEVEDESGYEIMPGCQYHTYSFDYTSKHLVMYEVVSYNI